MGHHAGHGLVVFEDGGVADNVNYWSSSQQTADMASHIDFADAGRQHGGERSSRCSVVRPDA